MSLITTLIIIEFFGWVAAMYIAHDATVTRTTISLAFVSVATVIVGIYAEFYLPPFVPKIDMVLFACMNLVLALGIALTSMTRQLSQRRQS